MKLFTIIVMALIAAGFGTMILDMAPEQHYLAIFLGIAVGFISAWILVA